ncbi:MAG: DUF669 domain-containing protein [Bdellovibrionota bacterium]
MKIDPDYSETVGRIPCGSYPVQVVDYEEKAAKATGNRYISWILSILGAECEGQHIYYNTPIKGRGANLLKQFLQTIDPSYDGGPFDADSFLDRELVVTVVDKKFPDGTPNPFPQVISVGPYSQTVEKSVAPTA